MLDLDRLRETTPASRPFRWAVIGDTFASLAAAGLLAREAPVGGFAETSGAGGEKSYRMANRTLVATNTVTAGALDDLSPAWHALVEQLLSRDYRSAVGALTGIPLRDVSLEIRICRYAAECWLDPHTDREEKLATHVIYLNQDWSSSWGGELRILNSARMDDIAARVVPTLGTSVVLVRSERSWHAVAPIRHGAEADRTSLLVHLLRR